MKTTQTQTYLQDGSTFSAFVDLKSHHVTGLLSNFTLRRISGRWDFALYLMTSYPLWTPSDTPSAHQN